MISKETIHAYDEIVSEYKELQVIERAYDKASEELLASIQYVKDYAKRNAIELKNEDALDRVAQRLEDKASMLEEMVWDYANSEGQAQ